MKLNYSKKVLIFSLIVLAGVLVLDLIFTNLLLNGILSINNKVQQVETSSQERLKELMLKDSVSASTLQREKLEQYFVGEGNVETVDFAKYLESLAVKHGVSQNKTLTQETVPGLEGSPALSMLRFRLNVSGKWSNVFAFLQDVENLPKISIINNVNLSVSTAALSQKEAKSPDKIWSADIDFSVFKLKN